MTLTPEDIYSKDFKKKISLWSYKDAEVNDFLDLVANYYEETLIENSNLKKRIKDLEEKVEHYEGLDHALEETLYKAQERADSRQEDAKKEAGLIIKEAEIEADKLLEKAQLEKERILQKANLKAEEIVQEARSKTEDKYRQYQELVEGERLFKIRFKTLLKTQLQSLEENGSNLESFKEEMEPQEEE